jgi:hypothetical protein
MCVFCIQHRRVCATAAAGALLPATAQQTWRLVMSIPQEGARSHRAGLTQPTSLLHAAGCAASLLR